MCAYDLRYFRFNYNRYSDVEDITWLSWLRVHCCSVTVISDSVFMRLHQCTAGESWAPCYTTLLFGFNANGSQLNRFRCYSSDCTSWLNSDHNDMNGKSFRASDGYDNFDLWVSNKFHSNKIEIVNCVKLFCEIHFLFY